MSALTAARLGPGLVPGLAEGGGRLAAIPRQRPRRGYPSGKADYLSRLGWMTSSTGGSGIADSSAQVMSDKAWRRP